MACKNPKYLQDIVEAEALPDYQIQLEDILQDYLISGAMPSKSSLYELYDIAQDEATDWDIQKAYDMLTERNKEHYYQNAAIVFTSSDDKDKDFDLVKQKYERDYTGADNNSLLTIDTHESLLSALRLVDENKGNYLKTEFKSIANVLTGDDTYAWMPSTLTSILGLSGLGKSIFLANFARDCLEHGYSVLYVSTEMSKADTLERIAKSLYKVEDTKEIILRKPIPIGKLWIKKVYANEATYLDIQNTIDSLKAKVDIVFIDYADEMKSTETVKTVYEEQGFIYKGLKKLAEKNNLPVVTASQTNRSAEGEDGGTKDYLGYWAVADSLKKVQLADTIFAIIQSADDKKLGNIALSVLKNRKNANGQRNNYFINYDQMRIYEKGNVSCAIEKKEKEDMPIRRK